ncbi:MAG: hypothetical protein K0B00_08330 [Rhodobacteraceae bacterium]|nr:hypothetical protein [Paracoccaceae bacterium]
MQAVQDLLAAAPATFFQAEIRIRGRRKPLPDAYFLVAPHVRYTGVLDDAASARLWPAWGTDPRPPLARPDHVVLNEGFAPAEAFFELDVLPMGAVALPPDFAARLLPRVNLWHTWAPMLSQMRLGAEVATEFPTDHETHAVLLTSALAQLRKRPARPKPPPAPLSEARARALCLQNVRKRGRLNLFGNREYWSDLMASGGDWYVVEGETGVEGSQTRQVDTEQAWRHIHARILTELTRFGDVAPDPIPPELLYATLKDIHV